MYQHVLNGLITIFQLIVPDSKELSRTLGGSENCFPKPFCGCLKFTKERTCFSLSDCGINEEVVFLGNFPLVIWQTFKEEMKSVQVVVRENDVERAMRVLKKMMQRDGFFRKMKLMRHYEKPSDRRVREKAESLRRLRKLVRKRIEREGY